jgi:prefoldin subunit 1
VTPAPHQDIVIDEMSRFVCTPIPDVQNRLKAESEALTKEMANLEKKEDYLEKTYTNSKNSLEQVLKGAS